MERQSCAICTPSRPTMFPTKTGWYWFRGEIWSSNLERLLHIKYVVEIAQRTDGQFVVYLSGAEQEVKERDLRGEWWGPLTPPWEGR